MKRSIGLLSMLLAMGCAPSSELDSAVGKSSNALLTQGQMIVYDRGDAVPQSDLVEVSPPGGLKPGDTMLGGTVLEGVVKISVRIDYAQGNVTSGIFQATKGKVRIVFPFTEHATVIDGNVTLTD